jgi:hypothetical protein
MEEVREKAGEGDWVRELYRQDAKPSGASAPTHYSITASTCHSIVPLPPPTTPLLPVRATRLRIGLRLGREATRRLSLRREVEGAGQ